MTDAAVAPCAFGGPPLRGRLRASPDDFEVEELPAFEASGSGEHALLWVEKVGENTAHVAGQLARFAGVPEHAVGYAGLKDRHARTRQRFSVQLPGRADPDWRAFPSSTVQVLQAERHARKLPRGALAGNRFRLTLRDVSGKREAAGQIAALLARRGTPNYFGEQRFGHAGRNVAAATAMFAGRRVHRSERGFLLSAARSAIFNAVLAQRVGRGDWDQALPGDVFQFDRSGTIFGPEIPDEALRERLARGEVHGTGPLWGRGELRSGEMVRELEQRVAATAGALCAGLEAAGLKQERRALRVVPLGFEHAWLAADVLELRFALPPGCYATTLLRELVATDGDAIHPD